MTLPRNPTPFHSEFLPEQDRHKVWFAQYGNKNGPKIIILHGGPGSKSKASHAMQFDLEKYHVIVFDQRGCGKSEPLGKLEQNTTQHLIADMERLREVLGINNWFVSGSSWGSTLALLYAQEHPNRVQGLLLGSLFLARKKDVAWSFYQATGVSRLFPDLYEHHQQFLASHNITNKNQAQQLLELINKAEGESKKAIVAELLSWEGNLMSSQEEVTLTSAEEVSDEDIASTQVFFHYDAHAAFVTENQILENMTNISHIPTVVVHGRHDILCPLDAVWELQKKCEKVRVVILPTSNHKLTVEGLIAKRLAFELFLVEQTLL